MGRPAIGIKGLRFGRLVVIERSEGTRDARWRCRCDCGNETIVNGSSLRSGSTQSCGCLGRERRLAATTKHGLTAGGPDNWHPLYRTWLGMKSRCYNQRFHKFRLYGARGIKVCDRWRNDFTAFLKDMGERPSPRHSIERVDNDGDYEPDNCVWATAKTQGQNKRNNRKLTYDGKTLTITEWSKVTGICVETLSYRCRRGWSTEDILTKRPRYGNRV